MGRGTGTDEVEKIEEGVVGREDGDMAAVAGGVGMIARSKYPSPTTAGPEAFNTPGVVTPSSVVPALDSIAGEKSIAGWLLVDRLSGDRAALLLP